MTRAPGSVQRPWVTWTISPGESFAPGLAGDPRTTRHGGWRIGLGTNGHPAQGLPRPPPVRVRPPSPPTLPPPVGATRKSPAIGVLTRGIGCMGGNDEGRTRRAVLDGPPCSSNRADAAPPVDGSSPMLTRVRSTRSAGIDATPATAISQPSLDTAMTRKAGNKGTICRWVDVTTSQDTAERGEAKVSRPVLEQR